MSEDRSLCRSKAAPVYTGNQAVLSAGYRLCRRLQKRRQHFVMVPWAWAERLQGASGQTYRVAICLLLLALEGQQKRAN